MSRKEDPSVAQNTDENREEIRPLGEEHSFDELAKEIASGALTRRRALKVAGVSLLGSMVLGLIPGVAEARKKKRCPKCPTPPTCGAGISTNCFQCGTPRQGDLCSCVVGSDGTPRCVSFLRGTFPTCTTNTDCTGGQICVDFTSCGPFGKQCAFPCS